MRRLWNFIVNIDEALCSLMFKDALDDETICAYLWRKKNEKWVGIMDSIFGKDHCKDSFKGETASAKEGLTVREKFDNESA